MMSPSAPRARQRPRRWAGVLAGVLGAFAPLLLTGCNADTETAAAVDAAQRFVQLAGADPARACALLAPRTAADVADPSCAKSLADKHIDADDAVQTAELAGHSAQVRLARQVIFLTRFDDGWKVVAAGCRRISADRDVPYECAVGGP